jgi:hypothetical protein
MHDTEAIVIGGVDAHADAHEVAALDERGVLLETATFPTTFAGYAGLLDWLLRSRTRALSARTRDPNA